MHYKLEYIIDKLSDREQVMLAKILREYDSAKDKYGPFTSPHEGYAVILEELDETWDVIKRRTQRENGTGQNSPELMESEIQSVGAMVLSFMVDLL